MIIDIMEEKNGQTQTDSLQFSAPQKGQLRKLLRGVGPPSVVVGVSIGSTDASLVEFADKISSELPSKNGKPLEIKEAKSHDESASTP